MLKLDKNGLASFLTSGSVAAGILIAAFIHVPATAAIPGTLDHLKCYSVKTPRGVDNYPGQELTLKDQFGARLMRVRKARLLCNPVDKNNEGILQPTAHLTCYKAREDKQGKKFQSVDVLLDNQFGQQSVTLKRAVTYCEPTNKEDEGAPPAGLDGFSCYRAKNTKGTPKFERQIVRLRDQFEEKFFDVRKLHSVCAPTAKPDAEISDPASHLACFKIKQRVPQTRFQRRIVKVENALETTLLKVKAARLLCVPSEKIIIEKDQDGDGFTPGQLDCDDNNSAINPDAEEICDGLDNNCDGEIDEDVSEVGMACYTPGDTSYEADVCQQGTWACNGGLLTCDGEVTPTTESCDGVDSNCNGNDDATDNAEGGGACDTGLLGACAAGTESCNGSSLDCSPDNEPVSEVCNNSVDDDCDGLTDEPSPDNPETCNNLDDNCNGDIDEDVTQSCYTGPDGTEGVGTCTGGTQTCSAGVFGACDGEVTPATETCAGGLDEDCDGLVDLADSDCQT